MGDPVFQIDDRFDKKFRVIGTTPEELRETKNTIGFAQYCPDQSQAQTLAGQLWAQWNYELQRCVRDLQWAVLCRQSPTGCFRLLPPDSWAHFELTDLRSGTLRASSGELAYSTHFVPLRWPEELAVIAEELAIFGSPEISATDELPTGPKEEPNDGTPQPAAAGILDPAAVKQHHTSREEKEYTPRLTAYMVENEPVLSKKKIRELTGGDRLSNAAFERSWDAANKATCKGFSSPGRRPSRGDFGAGAQSQETNSPANEK
ncbi:hypothetical protein GCM10007036_21170 [Alsobacter metallidurans]|uniref:Uncharacterized protein n=2 Tax=Alsobacter metallidurans TaxID=340221 RepID=A0A917I7E4_9HYPH|nr:hypothetical protein GCM10007036_21170 [Alsobacter metallidurans]